MDIDVRLGERERTRQERLARIEAVERGDSVEPRRVINFERLRDAAVVLWVYSLAV
jgi:predicted transcriptional regulator